MAFLQSGQNGVTPLVSNSILATRLRLLDFRFQRPGFYQCNRLMRRKIVMARFAVVYVIAFYCMWCVKFEGKNG